MEQQESNILIVDDEELTAELYQGMLEEHGFPRPLCCNDSREVMNMLKRENISVLLLDLNMPHITGQELLRGVSANHPEISVIILTGVDKVETAVECMKVGAFDFMVKPVDENQLVNSVKHALQIRALQSEVRILAGSGSQVKLKNPEAFADIITASPNVRKTLAYIEAVAASPKAVLISGESGTGKELAARAVHSVSGRSGEFVSVNVSGLDDTMFSDTLFGHKRGAFTGADRERAGLVERAAGGTLFLDEIGDLEPAPQVKLLRLLQEGEYYQLGSDRPQKAQTRIVAATNADLYLKQADGSFRRDLYYRLIAHHVELPPLRRRTEDIPVLFDHFLAETARALSKRVPTVPEQLYTLLAVYSFPGNVRELQSMVYDALSRHEGGVLSLSAFREHVERSREDALAGNVADETYGEHERISYRGEFPKLSEVEEYFVQEALAKTGGNQSLAARLLGVSQSTLSRRLSERPKT
ncbi:MAG: sigma-54 dependent transcriptional regulator [Spirochaeta sp.]|nr:sigma-54 dependent transcriptional regulator [Spirochaeta sp.]